MMKHNRTKTLAAVLATAACAMSAHGQANDALLNKLVSKGVLTSQEAADLKKETDAGFDKAYSTKTGMPDWVNQLKILGDVRGRYEMFKTDNDVDGASQPNKDRNRFRYRLRVGATVTMKDDFEVGFRLTSAEANSDGSGGDAISGNSTLQNNGSKKFIYVDTAYGKWTPIHSGPWLLGTTIGKMDNPFTTSDMLFDHDYTPEGAALQGGYTFNKSHALKFNGGVFVLDEINQGSQASDDPLMTGLQLRYDAKWAPKLSSSVGLSWYSLFAEENLNNADVPNINVGNTRYATATGKHRAGDLVNNYTPWVVDASLTYTLDSFPIYRGAFPIRIGGEYMNNPGASEENIGWWGGIFLGKSGKKNTWEASYRYKHQEADSWYEEVVDSDFGAYYQVALAGSGQGTGYRAGTGTEGHVAKLVYSLSDSFTIGATWFYTSLINPAVVAGSETESHENRVQIDAIWKF